jgi:hypothetical protein
VIAALRAAAATVSRRLGHRAAAAGS